MADLWMMSVIEEQHKDNANDAISLYKNKQGRAFTRRGYDWTSEPVQVWQDDAACGSLDPELFSIDERPSKQRDLEVQQALAACNGCPVRAACLETSNEMDRYFTVRGGQVPGIVAGTKVPAYTKLAAQPEPKKKRGAVSTSFKTQDVCAQGHDDWITTKRGDTTQRRCAVCRKESNAKWRSKNR